MIEAGINVTRCDKREIKELSIDDEIGLVDIDVDVEVRLEVILLDDDKHEEFLEYWAEDAAANRIDLIDSRQSSCISWTQVLEHMIINNYNKIYSITKLKTNWKRGNKRKDFLEDAWILCFDLIIGRLGFNLKALILDQKKFNTFLI